MSRTDREIETKAHSSIRFLNETLQYNANEPSLAFYRIQEHALKTLPTMVQRSHELESLQERMNGLVFDIEYSAEAVKDIENSQKHLNNILVSLEKGVSIGKQITQIRQQQMEQQLFQKKDGPLLSSLKN